MFDDPFYTRRRLRRFRSDGAVESRIFEPSEVPPEGEGWFFGPVHAHGPQEAPTAPEPPAVHLSRPEPPAAAPRLPEPLRKPVAIRKAGRK